jgi:hypothetical protein
MLELKYKKETDANLPHWDVYFNKVFQGYICKNTNPNCGVNEFWWFTSRENCEFKCFSHSNHQGLINELKLKLNGVKKKKGSQP